MLLVAAGGVVGALARHAAGQALPHEPGQWGWSTLLVNAAGAFLLCALLTRVAQVRARLLLATGVLGAFTTFSGFAVDAVLMADAGRAALGAGYLLVGVTTLLAAGLLGLRVAR